MSLIRGVPHPFPYQGSKRQLAREIVACLPWQSARLIEPFTGSGAITIAAAFKKRARRFVLNDIHEPLMRLWQAIIRSPEQLAAAYAELWNHQLGQERSYYDEVRDQFNTTGEPHCFLYLLARCVKAAVRYNGQGQFNNSPDNRRLGMNPITMRQNIVATAELLRGKTTLRRQDYREVLDDCRPTDLIYMDPPYQGVCLRRNQRYCVAVPYDEFVEALDRLNGRSVAFIVSYDGRTGEKVHDQPLPAELELTHREVRVGRSTQATLLGRQDATVESLHFSRALIKRLGGELPESLCGESAPTLFELT